MVGEIHGQLLMQRRRLEETRSRLERGGDTVGIATELDSVIQGLQRIDEDAAAAVAYDVALSRLEARAEENVELARLALHSSANDARRAEFHVSRAVEFLQSLEDAIVGQTRRIDQVENQRHFMNG